jgi:hypothetical protein
MATEKQIHEAIRAAVENLLEKRITQSQFDIVIDYYNKAKGTPEQRAKEALRKSTGLTDAIIEKRASASDNTDRVIRDLENILGGPKKP